MQFTKFATAQWSGTGKEGTGNIKTETGRLNAPYSYKSRFADGPGTNPEELVGAAYAGCFTMKTSFLFTEAGHPAENIETKCEITFKDGAITQSHLIVEAKVPGIEEEAFQKIIEEARANCPMSKLLNATITADAKLIK